MIGKVKVKSQSGFSRVYGGLVLDVICIDYFQQFDVPGAYPKGSRFFRISLEGTKYSDGRYTVINETELELIELLEDKPANSPNLQWVSVKSRYPKAHSGPVLVYHEYPDDYTNSNLAGNPGYSIAGFSQKDAGIWPRVKFWMPLPDAPRINFFDRLPETEKNNHGSK